MRGFHQFAAIAQRKFPNRKEKTARHYPAPGTIAIHTAAR